MGKVKRMSHDEKLKNTLDFFRESASFYNMTQLEKYVSKQKGQPVVKEIVQELVDDSLVMKEKIGSANYYWSFPSSSVLHLNKIIDGNEHDVETYQGKIAEIEEEIEELNTQDRSPTAKRTSLFKSTGKLKVKEEKLSKEWETNKDCDIGAAQVLDDSIEKVKDSYNIWVDNLFIFQSHLKKKYSMDRNNFKQLFPGTTTVDYLT